MEKKLQKLKDRLSDLSKRNRSLRLLKLYDKWTFDLSQLNARSTEILHKLILNQGPIHLVSTHSSDETEQRTAHRLLSLYRNVTALEEETGSYNVFVGYPFITGRFPDDTYIQAPVFLFPVRLERRTDRSPRWVLKVEPDEDVILNKTLLLAFRKYAQITVDEQIYEDAKQIPQTGFATWTCELLNQYGVICSLSTGELAPLPYTHMLKLLPTLKRLGNYFGKYGHEGYSWVDRQSFVGMDNTTHYELRQTLNQAIGQAEVAVQQKLLNGGFNPSDCWANEEKLSKGIRYLERYNHKVILSNISLWFWARFTGKEILAKLSKEAKSGGFKSEQWQVIEKAIVDIYKYGTDTQGYKLREIAARNKDFLWTNVIKPKPTFLGDAIPVFGDGKATDDKGE